MGIHSTTSSSSRPSTTNINSIHQNHQQWPVPSKPHASPPVARLPVSNLLPRLPASLHHQPEVSRSPTDTSQELSLSVRSVVTRSPLSSSSESSPSNVWFVRSHRTSSQTWDSNLPPLVLSRSPLRHTWFPFSKTPTSAPSAPSVLPFNQRTSNSPDVSVESVLRCAWCDDSSFPST